MHYKDIIQKTDQVLHKHELGKQKHIYAFWTKLDWVQHEQQILRTDAELSRTNAAFINLYPSLLRHPEPERILLRELGLFILAKGGRQAKLIWDLKLTVPESKHINEIAKKLADPEIQLKCKTYDDVVGTYPDKSRAVSRLVAIHVCNALRLHNIPFADSAGIDIRTWGPTTEFCSGKKYYSLRPLLSAYAPRDVYQCFGSAFADWIIYDLKSIIESSVRSEIKKTIRRAVQKAA